MKQEKLEQIVDLIEQGETSKAISRETGETRDRITRIRNGERGLRVLSVTPEITGFPKETKCRWCKHCGSWNQGTIKVPCLACSIRKHQKHKQSPTITQAQLQGEG